jgi:hypothetical protein
VDVNLAPFMAARRGTQVAHPVVGQWAANPIVMSDALALAAIRVTGHRRRRMAAIQPWIIA